MDLAEITKKTPYFLEFQNIAKYIYIYIYIAMNNYTHTYTSACMQNHNDDTIKTDDTVF